MNPPDDRRRTARWPVSIIAIAAGAAVLGAGTFASAQDLLDGRKLIPGSVTRAKLQKNAVGSDQIAPGAVTSAELRASAVRATAIGRGAVTGPKLASGAVTGPKIAAGAVGSKQIANGAVGTGQIADGSITAGDLAPGAALQDVVTRTRVVPVPTGPATEIDVSCAPGEVAVSGGYAGVPVANANVLQSRPIPAGDGSRPTGWAVIVKNDTGATTNVAMYVLCARR